MAAGYEYLTYAAENDVYDHVNRLAERLRRGITDILADRAPSYTVVGTDSMFKTVFTRGAPAGDAVDACEAGCRQRESCAKYDSCPKTGADVADAAVERWERIFWQEMKDRGIFLTANQFESQFVSYAHTDEDVEETLETYKDVL
jgi:glutamate-1-semialdehyde 2,1-aminomutase